MVVIEMNENKAIRLGARGSALSLAQVDMVVAALTANGVKTDFQIISTIGCRKQGTAEAAVGDKRNWMHDLEVALLANGIDAAIHSAKDVPADIAPETILIPVLQRATPNDVFIGKRLANGERLRFSDLPKDGLVGTSSLRRQAELLGIYPNLRVVTHRGNITTRLEKLDASSELDGIVLAAAGLERIGCKKGELLDYASMLPAVNQGILVAHCRRDDKATIAAIVGLIDSKAKAEFELERACIEELQGDCHSAIGCSATFKHESITGSVRIYSADGRQVIEEKISGSASDAENLGRVLAKAAIKAGGKELLAKATEQNAKVTEA
jgi:hydroxymethylbilane synthase